MIFKSKKAAKIAVIFFIVFISIKVSFVLPQSSIMTIFLLFVFPMVFSPISCRLDYSDPVGEGIPKFTRVNRSFTTISVDCVPAGD